MFLFTNIICNNTNGNDNLFIINGGIMKERQKRLIIIAAITAFVLINLVVAVFLYNDFNAFVSNNMQNKRVVDPEKFTSVLKKHNCSLVDASDQTDDKDVSVYLKTQNNSCKYDIAYIISNTNIQKFIDDIYKQNGSFTTLDSYNGYKVSVVDSSKYLILLHNDISLISLKVDQQNKMAAIKLLSDIGFNLQEF